LDLGGGVEGDLGAGGARAHRLDVRDVAADGFGAGIGERALGAVGAREPTDRPAVAHEPPDQRAADEAGAARDECGWHAREATASAIHTPAARRALAYAASSSSSPGNGSSSVPSASSIRRSASHAFFGSSGPCR